MKSIHQSLSINNIGAKGAAKIAEALKINAYVTSIEYVLMDTFSSSLSSCSFSTSMNQFISLSSNQMGADGAAKIAEALMVNATVTSIK